VNYRADAMKLCIFFTLCAAELTLRADKPNAYTQYHAQHDHDVKLESEHQHMEEKIGDLDKLFPKSSSLGHKFAEDMHHMNDFAKDIHDHRLAQESEDKKLKMIHERADLAMNRARSRQGKPEIHIEDLDKTSSFIQVDGNIQREQEPKKKSHPKNQQELQKEMRLMQEYMNALKRQNKFQSTKPDTHRVTERIQFEQLEHAKLENAERNRIAAAHIAENEKKHTKQKIAEHNAAKAKKAAAAQEVEAERGLVAAHAQSLLGHDSVEAEEQELHKLTAEAKARAQKADIHAERAEAHARKEENIAEQAEEREENFDEQQQRKKEKADQKVLEKHEASTSAISAEAAAANEGVLVWTPPMH